jgi:hypothetical protein
LALLLFAAARGCVNPIRTFPTDGITVCGAERSPAGEPTCAPSEAAPDGSGDADRRSGLSSNIAC